MTRLYLLTLLGLVVSSSGLAAQRTWDVGPDPSHDFRVLQDAFDAAQPGDVVIVHQQSYTPATCRVGIRLLSTSLWSFASAITVLDLPADQQFVMEGFGGPFRFIAEDCAGRIHIEDIRTAFATRQDRRGRDWEFRRCALVTANRAGMWNVRVENSCALFSACSFTGATDGAMGEIGVAALTMIDSDVTFAGGVIAGPEYGSLGAPAVLTPGVSIQAGRFRFAGSSIADLVQGGLVVQSQPFGFVLTPAIEATGADIVLDPDVMVSSNLVSDQPIVWEDLPYTRLSKTWHPSISPFRIEVFAPPGSSVVVGISEPVMQPLPSIFGDFWLDPRPGGTVLLTSATTDVNGEIPDTFSSLNTAWPLGATPMLQAIVVNANGIRLAEPVVGVMGLDF